MNKNVKRNKTIKYCPICHKQLQNNHSIFCSNKCHSQSQYEKYIEQWKNRQISGVTGQYGISNHIKRYLFEKYQNKCQLCGWSQQNPYTKTIPLEIHHKDGNYKNNNEENLQLLCPNCHSLTETYKNHNREGRKTRSKYITSCKK